MTGQEGSYVPAPGDMVVFDRPPAADSRHRLFRVSGHDAGTGMTTFSQLPEPLSARRLAELGARKASVLRPDEVTSDWPGAARRLAREGAGDRSKIQHAYRPRSVAGNQHVMGHADDQAALALAQQAADDTGEPVILARVRSGELLIGNENAFAAVAGAFEAQAILVVHPASPGHDGRLTLRQARELISGQRAREVISAALSSAAQMPDLATSVITNKVIDGLTGLLSAEQDPDPILPPGWRHREELMPRAAEILARIRSEEDTAAS
jgi:hypothetical protein